VELDPVPIQLYPMSPGIERLSSCELPLEGSRPTASAEEGRNGISAIVSQENLTPGHGRAPRSGIRDGHGDSQGRGVIAQGDIVNLDRAPIVFDPSVTGHHPRGRQWDRRARPHRKRIRHHEMLPGAHSQGETVLAHDPLRQLKLEEIQRHQGACRLD
jgi:hypothetical protein